MLTWKLTLKFVDKSLKRFSFIFLDFIQYSPDARKLIKNLIENLTKHKIHSECQFR